jgi:uncharacterized membrane protein SpoIIM required for sporulation
MITNRWIDKRRPHWDRLTALLTAADAHGLRSLQHGELKEMAFLYRQIASDLSALRQDGTAPALASFLNQLLARAHNFVYSGRKGGPMIVLRFLWYDYPHVIGKMQPFILASLVLTMASALLGTLLTLARPEFMHQFIGPEMVATIARHKMWTESVVSASPQWSSFIATNNLTVCFTTFAGGILMGALTLYELFTNGLMIGVIGTACAQAHMSVAFWSFVAPHGSLELPAIILSGAAGMRLGQGLLFPGAYSRRHSVAEAGRDAVRLMAGVIPMLIVAGTLEGFFSPSKAPVALKFLVGSCLFTALMFWWYAPRERPLELGEEAVQTA